MDIVEKIFNMTMMDNVELRNKKKKPLYLNKVHEQLMKKTHQLLVSINAPPYHPVPTKQWYIVAYLLVTLPLNAIFFLWSSCRSTKFCFNE